MPSGPTDHRPDVRLGVALGIVVVGATLAPIVIALAFGDRLPAEVPRHYGADGRPTALWPLWTSVGSLSAVTLLVCGSCAAACVLLRMPLAGRRAMAWTTTWVAVLLGGLNAGGLIALLDVTSPMEAGSISRTATVAMLAGLVLGVPVAALAREEPHGRAAAAPPPQQLPRLAPGAPARWRSKPLTSRALLGVLTMAGLALVVPAVVVGPFGDGAWLLLLGVASLVPAAVFARVRVHVDVEGLSVRGLGVRFVHVPVAEVAEAGVLDHLHPFWEFGGWGLRVDVHGRTGIVSRAGPALRVVRGDGSELLITVDDPGAAAATLHTLADGHHGVDG